VKTELFEQLRRAAELCQAIGEVPAGISAKLADARQRVDGLASITAMSSIVSAYRPL
jgi:hypothetical protein